MSILVAVSNIDGGIGRHLELTRMAVPDFDLLPLPEHLSLPAKIRTLREQLRRTAPTAVITHGVAAGVAARHSGGARSPRHVEFWHNDPFFLTPRRRVAYQAIARIGRAPDLQVFVNSDLIATFGDPRCLKAVIPNAVPVSDLPRTPRASTAVFVGRLSPEKGYQDLLEAWSRRRAQGWTLEVYGDGPLARLPVPAGVHRHGFCDRPLEVLAAADLVVIPSWTETGPYVVLEAASVAAPFVATTTGDMSALLSANGGWCAAPADVADLTRALDEAMACPGDELAARGQSARAWLLRERPFDGWKSAIVRAYQT